MKRLAPFVATLLTLVPLSLGCNNDAGSAECREGTCDTPAGANAAASTSADADAPPSCTSPDAASGTNGDAESTSPDAASDASGDSAPGSEDAATCEVLATSYDQSCTVASDCVPVPRGGNACDPCDTPPGQLPGAADFFCSLATVNASVSAQYLAALAPGRAKSGVGCPASCNAAPTLACVNGTCTIAN